MNINTHMLICSFYALQCEIVHIAYNVITTNWQHCSFSKLLTVKIYQHTFFSAVQQWRTNESFRSCWNPGVSCRTTKLSLNARVSDEIRGQL